MIPLGTYRHYKGGLYRVVGIAKHSETLEDMVVYEALYDNPLGKLWVRSLVMWNTEVLYAGKSVLRFQIISKS